MLKHWHTALALLALSVSTCVSAADNTNHSSDLPTYHSNVSQVGVTFFATDENNQPLKSLAKSDFAVVDNEHVVRNFRTFTRSDETSLDVVALVDLSESVAPRFRSAMGDVLHLVAPERSIPDDRIAALSFGGTFGAPGGTFDSIHPAILCSTGCRTADFAGRLPAVQSGGTTPLFDALIFGADFISHRRRIGVRPVIILFSDGNDTISLHSARQALQAVLDQGALLYSFDTGTAEKTTGSMFLRQASDATGGRYF